MTLTLAEGGARLFNSCSKRSAKPLIKVVPPAYCPELVGFRGSVKVKRTYQDDVLEQRSSNINVRVHDRLEDKIVNASLRVQIEENRVEESFRC